MNIALAKTLLHFIWQGGVIALALALVLKVVRPVSARVRYGAACLAMVVMLGAFGATLIHFWPHIESVPPPVIEFRWTEPATNVALPAPPGSPNPLWWLAWAWMLGASLFSLRSFASWFSAQRLRRVGVCAAPEHWQQTARHLADRIRVSRPVILLESCLTDVPVVLGCLRPVILLPAGLLTGFPAEQIEYFLIHELAHIRRWDYLVNLLQSAAENLLFYHPAVWWVSSVMRTERENCCDDVVAALGNAREFAAALAALAQARGALLQPALAANGGHLINRVRRLLGKSEPRRSAVLPVLLSLLAVAIAVAIAAPQRPAPAPPVIVPTLSVPAVPAPEAPVLLAQAQPNRQPAASSPDEPTMPDPYRKWLNEEVAYIISDAERNAFRSLRTDDERQMFIEQFWLRRDPTPDTLENEMREEHYRRIAYANERFSTNQTPGWKTDRGMIYIKFGPPDEKEIHPEAAPPKEAWRYRFITGIGANVNMGFVDDSGTGEFHMTKDPANVPGPAQPPAVNQQFFNGGGGRGAGVVAQFLDGNPTISVRPRARGGVVAIHVADREFVKPGQALVDLDSNNPPYDHILSPVEGFVNLGSLKVGQRVEAGQELLVIRARTRTSSTQSTEPPLSYFEAEARSLQYQAGFESAYLNLKTNTDRDAAGVKALGDAARDLDRATHAPTANPSEARAALDRLRTIVSNARAARLGSTAQSASGTPWWALDSQDPAATARAIEVTARVQIDGSAQEVSVVRSSDSSLNRSALEAVQSWRFPTLDGGKLTYAVDVLVDPSKLARR